MRRSSSAPNDAAGSGSIICHISAWKWCNHTARGPRFQMGEKNGMPFQTSTSPSRVPGRIASATADRGNDRYRFPRRITRYPSRRPIAGRACAAEVRIVTSMPASAQSRATVEAWTSDPPASSSSRSRQARTCTRSRPASRASPRMVDRWSAEVGTAAAMVLRRPRCPRARPVRSRHVTAPRAAPRLPGGDGLRAVAAVIVFFTHIGFLTGATFNSWAGPLFARFDVGVSIFFALSGFLLSRPYLMAILDDEPLPDRKSFYERRFRRIFPAYWVALTATYVWLRPESATIAKGLDYPLH